jgi:hypothetical protein
VTVVSGILDDGIPALRLYINRNDRAGLSIPTTANPKAIIKQVKRALQVLLTLPRRILAACAAPFSRPESPF